MLYSDMLGISVIAMVYGLCLLYSSVAVRCIHSSSNAIRPFVLPLFLIELWQLKPRTDVGLSGIFVTISSFSYKSSIDMKSYFEEQCFPALMRDPSTITKACKRGHRGLGNTQTSTGVS